MLTLRGSQTAIYAQGVGLGASKGKEIGKYADGYTGYVQQAQEAVSASLYEILTAGGNDRDNWKHVLIVPLGGVHRHENATTAEGYAWCSRRSNDACFVNPSWFVLHV